ncbi:MAG: ThuA domain-containing protein, partial [Planctomycetaceae bacterium]|nr:ThuA domain-containing protein [Planctomycetaceae bacterium]
VLGRPFGLRQMSRNGKNVVLIRDLTDTMYNPASRPFVSHFTGTDLIIEHIEKWVCPTILSTQLIGGEEFRFAKDARPHLVILCAEDEYKTEETLPTYALAELGHDYRVSFVFGGETEADKYTLPGSEQIASADILLVSARRRPLPADQLEQVRKHVRSGKPVLGIRTASHAFCLRNKPAPEGLADWPEFDAEVFGGSYTNHYGNTIVATVHLIGDGPLLSDIDRADFAAGGSLYKTAPLAKGANILMTGSVPNEAPEPLAWTFERSDGGKSFYTSLGHVKDFEQPQFRQLLKNALQWLAK